MNKFSILASDDDEKSLGGCDVAKQVTQIRVELGKLVENEILIHAVTHEGELVENEMMDSVVVMNELMDAWTLR